MKNIITLFIGLSCYVIAAAQPGTLDKSFGNNGKVLNPFFSDCNAMALQPDGKIIAAGSGVDASGNGGLFLSRYNTDGSLDLSFGDSGSVLTGKEVKANSATARGVAVQPDGKIVAAGSIEIQPQYTDIVVVRYNADGSLDKEFGTEGITITNIKNDDNAADMVLQADGKIVVTGMARVDNYDYSTSFLVRYNRDGILDESFGKKGIQLTSNSTYTDIKAIALQKDGKIITGCDYGFGPEKSYATMRYQTNGETDLTYGVNALARVTFKPEEAGYATLFDIIVQDDDKILTTGSIGKDTPQLAVARFMATGLVDSSFGVNGYASFVRPGTYSEGHGLAVQSDKKILAGGLYYDGNTSFGVVRFFANGIIDSSFGVNGMGTAFIKDAAAPSSMALQQDGKVLVGGTFADPRSDELPSQQAIVRFNGDNNGKQPLLVRIKRWLLHRGISWQYNPNVRYYSVQRSTDGGITYKEVAKVNNSTSTYEDASATAGNYYRIVAAAKDGSRTYSNTVIIDDAQSARIFPNPVRDNLQLQGLPITGKTNVSVMDLQGNVRSTATATGTNYSISTAKLSSGSYLLQIQHNGTTVTQPFVKE